MDKRAQQEMVGFVLIVVLVVVGLMIFLVVSLRDSGEDFQNNQEVDHMLAALLATTTDCATEFVPNYDSYREVLRACYRGFSCKNTGTSACAYLNARLGPDLALMAASTSFTTYVFEAVEVGEQKATPILSTSNGNCTATRLAAQKNVAGSEDLRIRLSLCRT